ncbi:RICIN domain-containing protein, partial [Catenulispora sp. NF23]|uniref:RICIN domain-containing protein n=1 Tax=Catenulispora pinistramenti TaxID=2705254 RepID=UPI001BAB4B46
IVNCLGTVPAAPDAKSSAPVVLTDCSAATTRQWTTTAGTVRSAGQCLQTDGQGTNDGTPVQLGPCTGRPDQKWAVHDGTLISAPTGKCLAVPGGSTTVGTPLVILGCDGGAAQQFAQATVPSTGRSGGAARWLPAALIAVAAAILCLLLVFPGPTRRAARLAHALRARLPKRRRRLSRALLARLADQATVDTAAQAFAAAGRDTSWWPYAVAVSGQDAVVWLAGLDVPAPQPPWAPVPGDPHAWTVSRADLDPETEAADWAACPVILGVLDDRVVVLDVSQSHDTLVIGGDARRAEKVRSALADQLEGGRVVLRGNDPRPVGGRPHWDISVDSEGWITVYGRRVAFAQPAAVPTVPAPRVEEDPLPTETPDPSQQTEDPSSATDRAGVIAVSSVHGPRSTETIQLPVGPQEADTDIPVRRKAVSSASSET